MKKLLILLLAIISFGPKTWAYFPDHYDEPNEMFHPKHEDYYESDNEWLKRKKRADIERASRPAVHYDDEARDYYRCSWTYNKNLDTWVCEKEGLSRYSQDQAVQICPYGYQKNPWNTGCEKIMIPANATLNSQGNGWVCIDGYRMNAAYTGCIANQQVMYIVQTTPPTQPEPIKYVYLKSPTPTRLPSSGAGLMVTAFISAAGLMIRKRI